MYVSATPPFLPGCLNPVTVDKRPAEASSLGSLRSLVLTLLMIATIGNEKV